MRLDRFITKTRIIDLKSNRFADALKELLGVALHRNTDHLDGLKLYNQLIDREKTMTTCLGSGIALPHLRIPMKRSYIFAVGRCPQGLEYEGVEEYKNLRLVFLLLASEKEKSYLNVLASLARLFQDAALSKSLEEDLDVEIFQAHMLDILRGVTSKTERKTTKFNRLILKEAEKVAKGAECTSVLVFGDTFAGGVDLSHNFEKFNTVLVSQSVSEPSLEKGHVNAIITVKAFSHNRLSQLRSAVLIGLTRGIIKPNERLCCVGGVAQSNQFDTVVVIDVEREFQAVFTKGKSKLPASIKPEVLERVLAIAIELGIEGREGKSIGSIFVIGNPQELKAFSKPLVLNPFFGYKEEDRNILNPFMDETIKEYSAIDGGFIIRGDGVIESAGTLIHTPHHPPPAMPSGLGTRHAAAASVSIAADCIAITVSSSTGQVTVFRSGQILPLIEKSFERSF